MPRPTVELQVKTVVKETTEALLCRIDGVDHWIPKSLIGADSDVRAEGDSGTLEIPEWFAVKEEIV